MKKDGIFHTVLQKMGSKLIHTSSSDASIYRNMVDMLDEDQKVEVFLEILKDDGTLAQLAKVHKCIRTLASEMGESFEDVKLRVKRKSGLCFPKEMDGEKFMICKSFADCSRDDLGLAIQACLEMGDFVGINLR